MPPRSKVDVFIYGGQSNASGVERVDNMPEYMEAAEYPYSPYKYLRWVDITGNPNTNLFGERIFNSSHDRYAFCDITNYWIDKSSTQDFYAIKCAKSGTAIAPYVTSERLPVWYADAQWLSTHNAYKGEDISLDEFRDNNSLAKNLTEGFTSLVEQCLANIEQGYDVKAIMWHQGESDRNAASDYYNNFKTFIIYIRESIYKKTGDVSDLSLPFIFGTISHNSTQYNMEVEQAQLSVAKDLKNVYYIDMSEAPLRSDNLHFNCLSIDYLGINMYNKLVELKIIDAKKLEVIMP